MIYSTEKNWRRLLIIRLSKLMKKGFHGVLPMLVDITSKERLRNKEIKGEKLE